MSGRVTMLILFLQVSHRCVRRPSHFKLAELYRFIRRLDHKELCCQSKHTVASQPTHTMTNDMFCSLTLLTDIMLVVSVPVLSEQITEVQPRVSTEGKLRTIAFFLAILLVPKRKTGTDGTEPLPRQLVHFAHIT